MSSLQKFHRRTNNEAVVVRTIGSGSNTTGYYLGMAGDGTSYMYVAPRSTEQLGLTWGSGGTTRGTVSTTNGLANTNTLVSFGQAAHPAAYYAKNLTTGGYNTWYLPAIAELTTAASNKSAIPFATANGFGTDYHWSSTEFGANGNYYAMLSRRIDYSGKSDTNKSVRAVRRSTI